MPSLTRPTIRLKANDWIFDALGAASLGLVAGLIRWLGMTQQSLWTDEMSSLGLAYEQLGTFFQHVYTAAAHPPFYFLIVHILHQQFGLDPITALRAPSVFAGAAAVSVVYWLGRLLVGRIAGLVAAVMVSLSPFAVWYSREGRMYSLLWLLILCSFLALVLTFQTRQRAWLVPYSVAIALALYTDYSAVMALVPQGALVAFLFIRRPGDRRFVAWVAGAYAVGWILFIPWLVVLPYQLHTLRGQTFVAYPRSLTTVVNVLLDQLNLRADYATMGALVSHVVVWAVAAAYLAAVLLALRYWKAGWARLTLSLTIGTMAVWLAFLAAGNRAILAPRVLGILAFGLALLVGCALQVTWERVRKNAPLAAPITLAAALLLVGSNSLALSNVEAAGTNGAHWPEISNYIAGHTSKSDALIYYPYGMKFVVDAYLPEPSTARQIGVGSWAGPDDAIQHQFELWAKGHPRVFLVFSAGQGIDVPLHDKMFQRDGYQRVSGNPMAATGVLEYVPQQ
jgi:Dolichyl-phosphate-mannose-protein mannosyltransferase